MTIDEQRVKNIMEKVLATKPDGVVIILAHAFEGGVHTQLIWSPSDMPPEVRRFLLEAGVMAEIASAGADMDVEEAN